MGANTSAVHSEGKSSGVSSVSNAVPSQRCSKTQSDTKAVSSLHSADQLVSSSSSREKKKKITGFATLRRKLIRRRRTSKSYDHGKVIREFVADWNPLELNTLVEEYESTAALKDLSVQADLARPPASTHKQDLSDLFDYKYASDVTLVFQGACFPAHRAILSCRCAYFRELLSSSRLTGSGNQQVLVDSLQSRGIDIPTFACLLRYLYTSDFSLNDGEATDISNLEVLIRLGQEFGTPNALEQDLRYLMETGDLADSVLVFASGQDFGTAAVSSSLSAKSSQNAASDYGFFPWLEIQCHKAVLSARSPFFRNLIQRRCRATSATENGNSGGVTPIRIVLDESVIPRRYARVLMQALYLDSVDLNCIVRSGYSASVGQEDANTATSGGAAAATVLPAPRLPTLFEEATELYQIGRFLDLDILSQGCEDVLVDHLCLDNLPAMLRWSELPHGSPWVRRQALQLLREEFSSIAQASVLLELDKAHLIEALQSDFLQASELEVLQAVLRWGEHQLVRRMEDREPNIVSQTAHSVSRKGVRRRDLNDVELRDILSELLPHVRVDHVLPPNHETLTQAIRRGLVSTPPSHMIGGDKGIGAERGEQLRLHAWIRGKNNGLYVKPRLFMPYFEESKSLLADQLVQEMELVRLRMVRMSSQIPDTLYMIDDTPAPPDRALQETGQPSATNDLDVVTGAVPVPDSETLQAMIRRERKLRQSPLSQRAYSLPLASRRDINRQIRLRVVREFNLPDSMAEELESAAYQFEDAEEMQQHAQLNSGSSWESRQSSSFAVRVPVPPKRMTSRMRPFQKHQDAHYPHASSSLLALDLPMNFDEGHSHHSQLSEFIPDIALATATSALTVNSQLNLPQFVSNNLQPRIESYRELQLDLGDGVSSGRMGHEWSIIRPNQETGQIVQSSNPIRLSTFRSEESVDDNWEGSHRPSPRSQRRARSSRAADVRVFI